MEHAGRTAVVLYGSESGNAEDAAGEVARMLERLHFDLCILPLDSSQPDALRRVDLVLITISTAGQGEFPSGAAKFWRSILRKKTPLNLFDGVSFSIFGLGDSTYIRFNWASRKLRARLLQLSAKELFPTAQGDEQHPEGYSGAFTLWLEGLHSKILEAFPLETGIVEIPKDSILQPSWLLDHSDRDVASSSLFTEQEAVLEEPKLDGRLRNVWCRNPANSERIFSTRICESRRVTPQDHWQDVRFITLSTQAQKAYAPGDALCVYPRNAAAEVAQLIEIMDWTDAADRPITFKQNLARSRTPLTPKPTLKLPSGRLKITLRDLLEEMIDFHAIPRRSLLKSLAHFTNNVSHKDRLLELSHSDFLDDYYDYATRPRRSILEVLQEFDSVRIPWQWCIAVLPPLRPRPFSICSGGMLRHVKGETNFQLLVAIVRFRTVLRKAREGVCTKYLASLAVGSNVQVSLQQGNLTHNHAENVKPLVMVGPGTGVAPMRSLILERLEWGTHQKTPMDQAIGIPDTFRKSVGQSVLFFGCRNQSADFFFRQDWEHIRRAMPLQVFAAFSRDQPKKIYVQDLLREHRKLLCQLLYREHGLLYICGATGAMPRSVREIVLEVFQDDAGLTKQSAEAYLQLMDKEGRIRQETW